MEDKSNLISQVVEKVFECHQGTEVGDKLGQERALCSVKSLDLF